MDLTAFINAYRGPLIGLIASWGAPWSDAIEIAQDSFSEAWLSRESCRGDWNEADVFGRWLRGVALNQYRNWARSRWRRRMRIVTLAPAILEQAVAPSDPKSSKHLEALRQAIERLPTKQRQVVLMHYLEETSVNEVATLLAVPAEDGRRAAVSGPSVTPPTARRRSFGLVDWKDVVMSVNLVPDDDLYAALRLYRVDSDAFEAAVRQRLTFAHKQRAADPLAPRLSPLLKCAAAFLPLEILAGCQAPQAAAKLAPTGGAYKLLSYLAFPAISLFVLLGATIFSISKIRSIHDQNGFELSNQDAIREATREWWRRYKWGAIVVFVATLTLMVVGASWILFLFYLISFGLLLFVLATFANVGLGNRLVIGQSCSMGLMFLSQATIMVGIGDREIHFVDQKLVSAIFLIGVLGLVPFVLGNSQLAGQRVEKFPRWIWGSLVAQVLVTLLLVGIAWSILHSVLLVAILLVGTLVPVAATIYRTRMADQRIEGVPRRLAVGLMVTLLIPLMAWMMNPVLWPATPSRIKHYVESFEGSPFAVVRWLHWEIVARWAIESKLDPDLSHPRRLLAEEFSGKQDRFILSGALRAGLLPADQVGQLKEYEELRRSLVVAPPGVEPQVIPSLAQFDWVIRASVLHNDLSVDDRDFLEKRLHATLEALSKSPFDQSDVLETALRVTQLLDVIQRPIDRDQYRSQVHDWLRKFHSTKGGGYQLAGGFKQYLASPVGSLEATSHGVDLMEIYGRPDGLDLNWVRAFLRPLSYRPKDEKWVAAAALDRLNHLPGVTRPTWLEVLYYERTLLAAAVLVGLCIYATISSPKLKAIAPADGSSQPEPQGIVDGQPS